MTWAEVTFQFESIHCYPDAPVAVSFLRFPHRHVFHVVVCIEQFHDNRDVEYVGFKRWLVELVECQKQQGAFPLEASCEFMARSILNHVVAQYPKRKVMVKVTEDKENGAIVDTE